MIIDETKYLDSLCEQIGLDKSKTQHWLAIGKVIIAPVMSVIRYYTL